MVTDAELSELLMRAFILRRVALINNHFGDAVVVGSRHCARTQGIREFLERNAQLLRTSTWSRTRRGSWSTASISALRTSRCSSVGAPRSSGPRATPRSPPGLQRRIACAAVRDVVVVGAAGWARPRCTRPARGWTSWCWRPTPPAGRPGSSAKIENYLGFHRHLEAALAGRAFTQAQKFGAEVAIASKAARLDCSGSPYAIELEGGHRIRARCVVIASGAEYRSWIRQTCPLREYKAYYGAMFLDKKVLEGEEVVVVGGATSPVRPQCTSGVARHVHMLVRSGGLAESMSRYLIRRIEESPRITLRTRTEIVARERERGAGRRAVAERRDRRDRGPPRPPPLLHDGASPCTSSSSRAPTTRGS